jgi:hypothetical protein
LGSSFLPVKVPKRLRKNAKNEKGRVCRAPPETSRSASRISRRFLVLEIKIPQILYGYE